MIREHYSGTWFLNKIKILWLVCSQTEKNGKEPDDKNHPFSGAIQETKKVFLLLKCFLWRRSPAPAVFARFAAQIGFYRLSGESDQMPVDTAIEMIHTTPCCLFDLCEPATEG